MSDIVRDLSNDVKFSPNKEFCTKKLKSVVLNFYLRNFSFNKVDSSEDINTINEISQRLLFPSQLVQGILQNFRLDIKGYLRFINFRRGGRNPYRIERYLKIYLHKLHRIVPVFDYRRARYNLSVLWRLLHKCNFYPQLSTRIACVIYVTDIKSKENAKLLQTNVRTITGCSGYAFHKIRNVLNVDALLGK